MLFKKKKLSSNKEQIGLLYYYWIVARIFIRKNILQRWRDYKKRRPHRSFRISRKRDYARPVDLDGYWKFTKQIFSIILNHKKAFAYLVGTIVFFNIFLIGILDQNFINSLQTVISTTGDGKLFSGGWGEIGKAGLIVFSTFSTGGLVQSPNPSQQLTMFMIVLFTWLAVVQMCRDIFAGRKKISAKDALYSCGGPIIPLAVIVIVIVVQAIPLFLATIIASAAKTTSFLAGSGVEQMVLMGAIGLLATISAYWIMGSIFAMIMCTNPGIYPFQALKISGDMISQRRMIIFKRVFWALFIIALIWAIIVIPIIIIAGKLNGVMEWFKYIPIIQGSMLVVTAFSIVFFGVYVYTLYRKIIDYDRKL